MYCKSGVEPLASLVASCSFPDGITLGKAIGVAHTIRIFGDVSDGLPVTVHKFFPFKLCGVPLKLEFRLQSESLGFQLVVRHTDPHVCTGSERISWPAHVLPSSRTDAPLV